MQCAAQLCRLALQMSGPEAHEEDWNVPSSLRIDADALSIAMHCGDLLAIAVDAFSQGGPPPEAPDLPLTLMRGLLASLWVMLKAQRRLTYMGEQRAGVALHLSFISTVTLRLAELAQARWVRPGEGIPRQSVHDPRAAEEQVLQRDLYGAAWQALCVIETSPTFAGTLPKIHSSAVRIMYHLLGELALPLALYMLVCSIPVCALYPPPCA